MEAEENDAIAEIRKTLLKKQQQRDSSVNIPCHYSPYIVAARMAQLIAETAEKLGMTIAGNVDTVTIFLQHDTTTPRYPSHRINVGSRDSQSVEA